MRIEEVILENFEIEYPIQSLAPLDKILFLDIETTGFTAKKSNLYMIGAAYYRDDCWRIQQFFAEKYEEEKSILEAFFSFATTFTHLVHFNGNNFDLPFLMQKCKLYSLPYKFEGYDGIDLYRRIAPYKFFLNIPNCKQKTLENFLGIKRDDKYNGGELIGVYHDYVNQPSFEAANSLLLHNKDDMKGLLKLLPLLAYHDLFNSDLKAVKVQANSYRDYHGNNRHVLIMKLKLSTPLPRPISAMANGCRFHAEDSEGTLKIPIYDGELKYFYSNYKDYYYLPIEDLAMHKSVASFVDKNHREQANASNCYTRKYSSYLPQWDVLVEPFFKREYNSKDLFFELTDEIKKNRKLFSKYANHILNRMVQV
ncbi:MAG: ribonuclease H-like domain-containing protein [Lachnospiraceae bacterium]|nr:ribonuclease H-like domain-containing protein [Lachnospiraceae bacterium]